MNRTNVVAAGAASGHGIAVFAAIVVLFGGAPQGLSATVGFGPVTILAIFAMTHVLDD